MTPAEQAEAERRIKSEVAQMAGPGTYVWAYEAEDRFRPAVLSPYWGECLNGKLHGILETVCQASRVKEGYECFI